MLRPLDLWTCKRQIVIVTVDLQEADCDCEPVRDKGRPEGVCPCHTWRPAARAATQELNNLKDPETWAL